MATEETTISELELADELLADMNIAVDTATETRAITLKQLKAWLGYSLPTGFIVASVGKINDERFTLLDGKTLSRVGAYEAFCNKVVENVQAGRWSSCTEDQFNQEVSQTGQCNKFVITNDYVRIPKFGNSMYSAVIGGKIPVFGNGMILGLTNGTYNYGLVQGSSSDLNAMANLYGKNVGTALSGSNGQGSKSLGLTTDPSKSGIEGTLSTNPMTIYYYMVVSTEGQTASVDVDINKVYEDLELKANSNLSNVPLNIDYVVETYKSGTNWYRKYKSGWIEQGGRILKGTEGEVTISLLKTMQDTNYNLNISVYGASSAFASPINAQFFSGWSLTTSSFKIRRYSGDTVQQMWSVCGQGS